MNIDILIDQLTDCLIDRETGEVLETEYKERITPIKKSEFKGWKFKWDIPQKNGYTVYELFLKNDKTVQGRIALRIDGGVADVDIVESNPHNIGHEGKYKGVGGHLFAIACQCSKEANCDGVVEFTSKTNLVEHYRKHLGAVEITPRRMVIFEDAAETLLNKYLRK